MTRLFVFIRDMSLFVMIFLNAAILTAYGIKGWSEFFLTSGLVIFFVLFLISFIRTPPKGVTNFTFLTLAFFPLMNIVIVVNATMGALIHRFQEGEEQNAEEE